MFTCVIRFDRSSVHRKEANFIGVDTIDNIIRNTGLSGNFQFNSIHVEKKNEFQFNKLKLKLSLATNIILVEISCANIGRTVKIDAGNTSNVRYRRTLYRYTDRIELNNSDKLLVIDYIFLAELNSKCFVILCFCFEFQ